MFAIERRNAIIKYLEENGSISVDTLAAKLNVTTMTIRRDLKVLEDANMIARTFGGAVLKSVLMDEISYKEKSEVNKEEKIRIAGYAATLIKEGETIILDSGTTNMEVAKKIKDMKKLNVITNDVMIASFLSNSKGLQVYCTGGLIQTHIGACIGASAAEFFKNIIADKVFLAASSVDLDKGVSTPTFEKAYLKKQMMMSSQKIILVCDSSKFGKKSFTKVCSLNEFDLIITDNRLDKKLVKKIQEANINLALV